MILYYTMDFAKLINLKYIFETPPVRFSYIIYFYILLVILYIFWVIGLYIYIFRTEKKTPKFRFIRKVAWTSFALLFILLILLFSRKNAIIFLSWRILLELLIVGFLFSFLYFLYYLLFKLKKNTKKYYSEITRQKYLPKKKKRK